MDQKIRRYLFLACGVLACSAVLFLVACSAGQVRATIDATEPEVQAALDYHNAVSTVIDRVAAGGIVDAEALAAIRATLKPEDQAKLDEALQKGADAAAAVKRVADGIGTTARAMLDEMQRLKASLSLAQDKDDATAQVVTSVLTVIGSIFGVGGVGAGIVAAFRRGRTSGAQEVAKSVSLVPEDYEDLKKRDPSLAADIAHELEPNATVVRPLVTA